MEDLPAQIVDLESAALPLVQAIGLSRGVWSSQHTLTQLEVNYIASGEATALLNGEEHQLRAGRAYLYLPGDVFSAPGYRDDGRMVLHWVKFTWPGWRRRDARQSASVWIRRECTLEPAQQVATRETFDAMREAHEAGTPGWELAATAHLLRMLALLREAGSEPCRAAEPQGDSRIAVAIAFMERHLDRHPALAEIARASGVSEDYFARLFRLRTGLPPARWMAQRRLQEGRRLLARHPDLPVAEIARTVGFAQPGHFTRSFQRLYGLSPRRFRIERAWRGVGA